MTPAEAAAHWGLSAANVNEGHAKDLVCPACGSRDEFHVGAKGVVVLRNTGEVAEFYAVEVSETNDDYCKCAACEHDGVLSEFRVPGLDDYIRERSDV